MALIPIRSHTVQALTLISLHLAQRLAAIQDGSLTSISLAWALNLIKVARPVLAPFDMVLVGFRDTSIQIVSGETSAHSDDVKLFFESVSPDWPGVYLTVYHLLTSPLLTGHSQRASNDLMTPPAQGYQIFWDGNYMVS